MAKTKITVLGAGLVGSAIAHEIAGWPNAIVQLIDKDAAAFQRLGNLHRCDCKTLGFEDETALSQSIADSDFVVSAVLGFLGFKTLKTCLQAGKNTIDIAFMPEDASELNQLAVDRNVTALVDFGVAPGMSNLLLAYAGQHLDEFETGKIFVGGLPLKREGFWAYKAVFSPIDVIEEYLRPARVIENFEAIEKAALSDAEIVYFDKPGALEAFNTDGLRSIIKNVKARNMYEKTLRYPGYLDKIKLLKDAGFLSDKPIKAGTTQLKAIDFTSALLIDEWKLEPGEEDFTVMRILAEGLLNNQKTRISWDLYDSYDRELGIHSMARTTGYTATCVLKLWLEGEKFGSGVIFPEQLAEKSLFVEKLLQKLSEKNIVYQESKTRISE